MSVFQNRKKIFTVCLLASFCSHLLCLIYIQARCFFLHIPDNERNIPSESFIAAEKTQILKEAFVQSSLGNAVYNITPSLEEVSRILLRAEPVRPNNIMVPPAQPAAAKTLEESPLAHTKIVFPLPDLKSFSFLDTLPKMVTLSAEPPLAESAAQPCAAQVGSFLASGAPPLVQKPFLPSRFTLSKTNATRLPEPSVLKKAHLAHETPYPLFPKFPSLNELKTISYADCFDIELSVLKQEETISPAEGASYLFAITLIPKPDIHIPRIRQHYSFLIDRSNSVQKENLSAIKSGIMKALEDFSLDDSFNIIAFDSKIDKLSTAPVPATPSAIRKAKEFLEQIELGSFFTSTNLYKPLFLTIPPDESALHTVIVLTDGECLSKPLAQQEVSLGWTLHNRARATLFALGFGNEEHLTALETAASLNKGKLYFANNKRSLKRRFLKLMKALSHPIATHIAAKAIQKTPDSRINLFPVDQQMANLYLNEPYVLIGTTNQLDDFVLLLQGKANDKWIHIKKTISFVNAKKASSSLQVQLALQNSYQCYQKYLQDSDPDHLVEARKVLEPYNLHSLF